MVQTLLSEIESSHHVTIADKRTVYAFEPAVGGETVVDSIL